MEGRRKESIKGGKAIRGNRRRGKEKIGGTKWTGA